MTTAIIIDDLRLARASLRAEIEDHCPEIELLGEADGVVSGAKLIRDTKPDLIFLDIEMNDGNGFDLLDILPEVNSKVIFVTASQDFAIKAFQYAAVDYLLKPVDPQLLKSAIAKHSEKNAQSGDQLAILKEQHQSNNTPSRIVLQTAEEIKVAKIIDIIRCESMGNYTQFYFSDKTKLLVTKTLKEYDELLSNRGFVRCHQSHLINLDYVKSYIKSDGGYIMLTNDQHIPVSVRKKPEIIKLLKRMS